jgi:hypothetical protein
MGDNMQVTANWKLPVYQVIGPVIRVHWDYTHTTGEDDFDQPYDIWTAQEAVVPLDADRETFVQIVNDTGGDGEALADGWFQ